MRHSWSAGTYSWRTTRWLWSGQLLSPSSRWGGLRGLLSQDRWQYALGGNLGCCTVSQANANVLACLNEDDYNLRFVLRHEESEWSNHCYEWVKKRFTYFPASRVAHWTAIYSEEHELVILASCWYFSEYDASVWSFIILLLWTKTFSPSLLHSVLSSFTPTEDLQQ